MMREHQDHEKGGVIILVFCYFNKADYVNILFLKGYEGNRVEFLCFLVKIRIRGRIKLYALNHYGKKGKSSFCKR